MPDEMNDTPVPDDGAIVERAADLTAAHIEDELVIMHIGTGSLFQLNRVAARIWDNLDTPLSMAALYDLIQQRFEVSADTCRAQVGALIAELETQGLVRVSTPA